MGVIIKYIVCALCCILVVFVLVYDILVKNNMVCITPSAKTNIVEFHRLLGSSCESINASFDGYLSMVDDKTSSYYILGESLLKDIRLKVNTIPMDTSDEDKK